ncbi:MAG TPA: hypothetical protein VJK72_03700 [Candidatus Nanoarchaeia archaeon]|nr:hypothetical protein [Candidatus Nanoarchaeia archaeon]
MSEAKFLGVRLERDFFKMVEETADDEHTDRTTALKQLIELGRKEFLLRKYLELYRTGRCSIDKAAKAVGITLPEMMKKAADEGITSSETLEEYREGLKRLALG